MKRILQRLGLIGFTYVASSMFWLAAGFLLLAEACRRGMAGPDTTEWSTDHA